MIVFIECFTRSRRENPCNSPFVSLLTDASEDIEPETSRIVIKTDEGDFPVFGGMKFRFRI